MNVGIGLLAIGFAVICAVLTLIGAQNEKEKPRVRDIDYTRCYQNCVPKEL